MPDPGTLAKLRIEPYLDPEFTQEAAVAPLTVQINPSEYRHNGSIDYTQPTEAGAAGASPTFNRVKEEVVTFDLVFDATGAVPDSPGAGSSRGVTDQVETFKKVVYEYQGKIHSPHYLKLLWGTFVFHCRLQSFNLTYQLFSPNGAPLRARASATFVGFTDEKILQAKIKKSSADLTHVIVVQAGDTLPLLCHRIYGRSRYYSQVAAVNGLTGFRGLQPGMQLFFPPLSGSA